jgi:hypothetical protein
MVLCSGCIEVGYKTEVTLSLFKQGESTIPVIVDTEPIIDDYDYPIQREKEEEKPIVYPEIVERGFAKFNN